MAHAGMLLRTVGKMPHGILYTVPCSLFAECCVDQYIHSPRTLMFEFYLKKYYLVWMIWLEYDLFKLS